MAAAAAGCRFFLVLLYIANAGRNETLHLELGPSICSSSSYETAEPLPRKKGSGLLASDLIKCVHNSTPPDKDKEMAQEDEGPSIGGSSGASMERRRPLRAATTALRSGLALYRRLVRLLIVHRIERVNVHSTTSL